MAIISIRISIFLQNPSQVSTFTRLSLINLFCLLYSSLFSHCPDSKYFLVSDFLIKSYITYPQNKSVLDLFFNFPRAFRSLPPFSMHWPLDFDLLIIKSVNRHILIYIRWSLSLLFVLTIIIQYWLKKIGKEYRFQRR